MQRERLFGCCAKLSGLRAAQIVFGDLARGGPDAGPETPAGGCKGVGCRFCLSCRKWQPGHGIIVKMQRANFPGICQGFIPSLATGAVNRLYWARPSGCSGAAGTDPFRFEDEEAWEVRKVHSNSITLSLLKVSSKAL